MKRERVLIGCSTCTLCTGAAMTGFGRNTGRVMADIATLGVSAWTRKKCKACDHPMSERQTQQVQVLAAQPVIPAPPPGWSPDPTDQRALCWWDGRSWHPGSKHYPGAAGKGSEGSPS